MREEVFKQCLGIKGPLSIILNQPGQRFKDVVLLGPGDSEDYLSHPRDVGGLQTIPVMTRHPES